MDELGQRYEALCEKDRKYMARVMGDDHTQYTVRREASKWSEEEWPHFADATPQLAGITYGSPEYKVALAKLKPALIHHNAANTHHPEHFAEGVYGMTLLDLVEMLCDWKAAGERHADGCIKKSIEHNRERFNMSPQLVAIFENTAKAMGWIEPTKGTP